MNLKRLRKIDQGTATKIHATMWRPVYQTPDGTPSEHVQTANAPQVYRQMNEPSDPYSRR